MYVSAVSYFTQGLAILFVDRSHKEAVEEWVRTWNSLDEGQRRKIHNRVDEWIDEEEDGDQLRRS